MNLELFTKYYVDCGGSDEFQGWNLIVLRTKPFQFRWFTDCGYHFLYINLGKKCWRVV